MKMKKRLNNPLFFNLLLSAVFSGCSLHMVAESPIFAITEVSISPQSFNPSRNETAAITYRLSRSAFVNVKIYGPDDELIRTLLDKTPQRAGKQSVIWDGRDDQSRIVPDEAFIFTVSAETKDGQMALYDPSDTTAGETVYAEKFKIDKENGIVTYTLLEPARLSIRIGIENGPLLKTLVDWRPRLSGPNEEQWDGKDASGVIDLFNEVDYSVRFMTYALAENSAITTGNSSVEWFEYKSKKQEQRESEITKRGGEDTGILTYPGGGIYREPQISVSLPEAKETTDTRLPVVSGITPVKVVIDKKDRKFITNERYELAFYLDFEFLAEEEEGFSPYTMVWDTREVSDGEHILTCNLIGFQEHRATRNLRVYVKH
jgi:hypothetical protein